MGPACVLGGHEYAVRKVAWSPHLSDSLLSASYDMTCRIWSDGSSTTAPDGGQAQRREDETIAYGGGGGGGGNSVGKEMGRMGRHTEFVTGVDWCLFGAEGWCASCGWDERVLVWDVRAFMGR